MSGAKSSQLSAAAAASQARSLTTAPARQYAPPARSGAGAPAARASASAPTASAGSGPGTGKNVDAGPVRGSGAAASGPAAASATTSATAEQGEDLLAAEARRARAASRAVLRESDVLSARGLWALYSRASILAPTLGVRPSGVPYDDAARVVDASRMAEAYRAWAQVRDKGHHLLCKYSAHSFTALLSSLSATVSQRRAYSPVSTLSTRFIALRAGAGAPWSRLHCSSFG